MTSRSPRGGRSSSRSPTTARSCSSSRTSTGPTTGCSTSSTTSWTGRRACRCWCSAPRARSCSSAGPVGAAESETRSRSTSRRSPTRMRRSCSRSCSIAPCCPPRRSRRCSNGPAATLCTPSSSRVSTCERGTVDDLALPESVHGLIAARLDALPADEKALLQDAAVIGKVFWSGALGDDEQRGAAALARAQGVHPARATLVGRRRRRVRVPPRARARCRLRADPTRRPRGQARPRGGVARGSRPPAGPRRAASRTTTSPRSSSSGRRNATPPRIAARAVEALRGRGRSRSRVERVSRQPPTTTARRSRDFRTTDASTPRCSSGSGVQSSTAKAAARRRSPRPRRASSPFGEIEAAAEAENLNAMGGFMSGDRERTDTHLERATQLVVEPSALAREGIGADEPRTLRLSQDGLPGGARARPGSSGDGRAARPRGDPGGGPALRRVGRSSSSTTLRDRRRPREHRDRERDQLPGGRSLATTTSSVLLRLEGRLAEADEASNEGHRVAVRFGLVPVPELGPRSRARPVVRARPLGRGARRRRRGARG